MNVQEILASLRKDNGISKTRAAQIAGVSVNTYSSWEIDGIQPKVQSGINLADHYKVTLDYLYGRKTESKSLSNELTEDETEYIEVLRSLEPTDQLKVVNLLLRLHRSGDAMENL
ncbi:helix-turn-helix transcriptional regulator [Deltaproteobacteria bacterium IMCC39524]|nr:helix-turn-helix transcriptional regulator [Deltaproteobacteria bacterium IMCC39524]